MYKRIALIGLDGSGKSANIERMKQDGCYGNYRFVWVRWKPALLKPAYWLLNKKLSGKRKTQPEAERKGNTEHTGNAGGRGQLGEDYHAKSAVKGKVFRNPAVRTVWMTLALLDYIVQFYAKTAGLLVRNEKIIFDRFYLDLFVDQGINFGYSPEKICREIRRYGRLFPKTERLIYIRVSPETCYKRKDDIPGMDYLMKRYEIYELLSRERGWITVDGEKPFEEVYAEIKSHLIGK